MAARGQGEGIRFLRSLVRHQGDDCVGWPMSRNRNGHGHFGLNGRTYLAHRFLCELVNGAPPTRKHEAAHSCGRGHEGCVNPKHLSWKTRTENQRERYEHGRKKPQGGTLSLTPEQVAEIRALAGIETNTALAAKFGVSRGNIRQVILGKIWVNGVQGRRGWRPGDPSNPFRRTRTAEPRT